MARRKRPRKKKRWYTSKEVQLIFDVSQWTVLRWAKAGRFGAIKIGSWYFKVEEVDYAGTDSAETGSGNSVEQSTVQ